MTAPGAGQAAAVWVSIIPDLGNFGRDLVRQLGDVGRDGGQAAGEQAESGLSKAAKGIAAAGAVIGAGLGLALVGAMNVEAANDKLSAQLGLSAQEAERYGKVAGDLYSANYGDSLETVNEALRLVTQNVGATATSSDADLQRITASVLDVATAFDQDLGGTTTAVGQLMKTGLATDATQALDIITAGFQNGVDKSGDFLDTLNEYGGQFAKFGLDGATATGLLSQGLQGGARDADIVADAIKEFSIRAVDGSTTSAAGFAALGLSAADMTAIFAKGGPAAAAGLDTVIDGLNNMTDPVARNAAGVALFGTQFEDLGPAFASLDPSAAVGSLGQVGGAAAAMGATLADNAGANLEIFKRSVMTAFVDIVGGWILPIVTGFALFLATSFGPALATVGNIIATVVIPALQSFGGFIAQNRTPITIIAALITAVFLPGLIALGVQSTITGVRVAAAWVVTQVSAIGAAAVHSVQVVRMVASWVLLGAQSLVHAARVAGSWLLVGGINAVAAAAAVAVAVGQMIGRWVAIAVTSLLQAGRVAAAWLISSAGAVAAGVVFVVQVAIMVGAWVLLGVQSLLSAARVAAAWLIAMGPIGLVIIAVVGLVALIIANWDTVKAVTAAVFGFIGNFLASVWAGIVAVFNTSLAFLVGLWNSFWAGVRQVASTVWNAISSFIASVWAGIQAGFSAATTFLAQLWSSWWAGISAVASTVWGFIRGYIDLVWQVIKGLFTAAMALLRGDWAGFWAALQQVGTLVFNAIRGVIDLVWSQIRAGFTAATTFVQGLWQGFWNILSTVASTVFSSIKRTIDTVIGGIIGAFRFVVDQVGVIWAGIKRLLAIPINFMIGTVYNGGIVKAWNFVAGLLGIGQIRPIGLIPEFAAGGRVRGGGTTTSDSIPAMLSRDEHVWTAKEVRGAGGHEQVLALREAAENGDLRFYARGGAAIPGFAAGGPVGQGLFNLVKAQFPRANANSLHRAGDPGYHGRGKAVDLGEQGFSGGAGRPYLAAMNRWIHDTYGRGTAELIYDGAGDDRPDLKNGRPLNYGAAVTAAHRNHVHWAAESVPGGPAGSFVQGGGGGFGSFILDQVRSLYDGATAPIIGAIRGLVGNPPPQFREIPPGMAATAIKSVGDFLFGKAAAADGAAGVSGGSGVERWRPIVHQALGLVGQPRSLDNTTLRRMNQESSGNPLAVNRTDINARRGTPSKGLMQVIDPTFRAYRHPATVNNVFDPLANVAASMRYALARYGSLPKAYDRPGGYDDGGWMQPGFGSYFNGTSKPEAVLTNEQWKTLAERAQGGEDRSVTVHMEVHNPVAERSSETAVRKLRTASALGMFG